MLTQFRGLCAPLPQPNVDTDIIMPKRFLRTITRDGLADGTFADLRFDEDGNKRPDFVLHRPPWKDATILIVGDNFGCGSSREHAVWGLIQLGIRAVIGTGFAGIFFDNARKNGLALPVVTPEFRDRLVEQAGQINGLVLDINIVEKIISIDKEEVPFSMDSATQFALIEGRDDTLDTLRYLTEIKNFERQMSNNHWVHVQK